MSKDSGKYDALCKYVLEKSKARAAIVIVVNGSLGSGMAVKEEFSVAGGEYHVKRLPTLLRQIADHIEAVNGG